MQATLNVRIDPTLKERGDKVLRENGISVTEAVRALWKELVDTRQIPSFMQQAGRTSDKKKRRFEALSRLCATPAGEHSKMTDAELHDLLYEEALRRYEALT